MSKATNETNQTSSACSKQRWLRKVLIAVFWIVHFIIGIARWYDRTKRLLEILKSWLTDL